MLCAKCFDWLKPVCHLFCIFAENLFFCGGITLLFSNQYHVVCSTHIVYINWIDCIHYIIRLMYIIHWQILFSVYPEIEIFSEEILRANMVWILLQLPQQFNYKLSTENFKICLYCQSYWENKSCILFDPHCDLQLISTVACF